MLNINDAKVILFKTIDSTNNEAQRIIENRNIDSPIWIISESQKNGKGRSNNLWISKKGNFFGTLIIPIVWDLNILPILSCVVALSVHESILNFCTNREDLKVKWPNDILFQDKKISGILIENQISKKEKFSIIGIGVNINSSPNDLNYQTIYLNSISANKKITSMDFFNVLKEKIHNNINRFDLSSLNYFIKEISLKSWKIGEEIYFIDMGITKKAIFKGLSKNYEIMLDISGEISILSSGEIAIINK